jgi:uncharacterized protein (DUF58 family)
MILPEFKELVQLQHSANNSYSHLIKKTIKNIGGHLSSLKGRGMEFNKIRKYELGDDVRHIHWKITAKTGQPHIKTFIEEKQKEILLFIDANENMNFGTKNTFKSIQAARIAASIMWQSYKNKDKVGGCVFGSEDKKISFHQNKKSNLSIIQILKELSNNNPAKSSIAISTSIRKNIHLIKKNTTIFIISDFIDIDNDLLDILTILRKKSEIIFVIVRDPFDSKLPKLQNIKFNFDKEEIVLSGNDNSLQNAYTRLYQENENKINDIMRMLKISKIEVLTNHSKF